MRKFHIERSWFHDYCVDLFCPSVSDVQFHTNHLFSPFRLSSFGLSTLPIIQGSKVMGLVLQNLLPLYQ